MNSICDNLLRSNKVNINSPKSYDLCTPDSSDKSNEPEPKSSRRFDRKGQGDIGYKFCLFLLMSFSFTADDEH